MSYYNNTIQVTGKGPWGLERPKNINYTLENIVELLFDITICAEPRSVRIE